MTEPTKLTTAQVDDLCIAYDKARMEVEVAERKASSAKAALLEAIRVHGFTPTNAEKTQRLEGLIYVADATTATTVEITEIAVAELQLELSRAKLPRTFEELFERKVKHTLLKDAADTLKLDIGGLPEKQQTHLLGIFARCFKAESKAPKLTVQLCAVLMKKEAAAAKKKKGGKK